MYMQYNAMHAIVFSWMSHKKSQNKQITFCMQAGMIKVDKVQPQIKPQKYALQSSLTTFSN